MAKCRISIHQTSNSNDFIFTFGFVRSRVDDVRAFVDMEYVTSDELGDFVRLGFVLDVQFTYVVGSGPTYYHISIRFQHTLDDVHDSRAMVVYGDGLAPGNRRNSCQ